MGQHTDASHLEMGFLRNSPSGKTKVWFVHNTTLDESLGVIRWHGPWRKYVFVAPDAVYDARCLRDIAGMLDRAMNDYRESKGS